MGFLRYVAVGDSQTEGMNDGDEATGYRGWADRLAELLAAEEPGFRYANLAVRGRLTAEIRAEQVGPALALAPDLVTVMAGMNDLVRPSFDAAAVAADLDATYAAFASSGATVVTFTFPDLGRIAPLARRFVPRVVDLNARIRASAARHGVLVVDTFGHDVTVDPRLWSADRIHAAPLGHARIASVVAHTLGLPGPHAAWTEPLPPLPRPSALSGVYREAAWAAATLAPWALRRLRGVSSGDGRTAKRPELLPVLPQG
ncbi:SGNH/GDSL hydrolase family protein [Actinocorallia sp. A-T 12471]|uniref:SGNH/GDSL hydrolase family protein n=1 Tax=Actinocorallia sp. A-T 12471 TaxID=3089813 RepID=UPI0029D3018A|nr:SGNH/GDSL hydrolase family protein [Actinocorallia sp. A-T 12471]MDX6742201.1 SGNH/GDSL hydrolase family protein [Actinocorallia sp. A-T 12471]